MLQDCTDATNLKYTFPDVDYAFLGYNSLKGFPMAIGSDPGFTYPIFAVDYSQKSHSGDCRYSVPHGLVITPDVSCDVSFTSSVIKTTREYESELSVSAHVSGGGFGVQFSASAGYNEAKSEISKGETSFVISTAKCNYYTSKLRYDGAIKFDSSFLRWVEKLNQTDDDEGFFAFFEMYGTHYPIKMTFGARFTYENHIKTSELTKMESSGVNVAVSASYSGSVSVGGGFNMDSKSRKQASDFSQKAETRIITVGAAPPSNGDATTWASTVQQNPVPTEYDLDEIENLFSEQFMGELNIDFVKIQNHLKALKMRYWESVKRQAGVDDFKFDLEDSIIVPNWKIEGRYVEGHLSYGDCFRVCKGMGQECVGLSFCADCGERGQSLCNVFDSNFRSSDVKFDEKWQTIVVSGEMNLNSVAVSEMSGDPTDTMLTNIQGSSGSAAFGTAQRDCRKKVKRSQEAVAYTFGYIFNDLFALCKVYGSKKTLLLERKENCNTYIKV